MQRRARAHVPSASTSPRQPSQTPIPLLLVLLLLLPLCPQVWLDEELMKTAGGRDSPGPNTYRQPGGIGRMVDSKHNTAPTWRQGTENRFRDRSPSKDVPGAGTYKTYGAIGQQTLSQKKTLPSPKIGTGHRDAFKKVRRMRAGGWGLRGRGRCERQAAGGAAGGCLGEAGGRSARPEPLRGLHYLMNCTDVVKWRCVRAADLHLEGAREGRVRRELARPRDQPVRVVHRAAEAVCQVQRTQLGLRHGQGGCRARKPKYGADGRMVS